MSLIRTYKRRPWCFRSYLLLWAGRFKTSKPPMSNLPPRPHFFFKTGLDLFFYIHFNFKNAYSVHVAYGSSKDAKLGISGSNSPPRQWSNSPIPQHKWWWNAWLVGKLISTLLLDKLKLILLKNHIYQSTTSTSESARYFIYLST